MIKLLLLLLALPGPASSAPFRGESCARCHTAIRDASPFKAEPSAGQGRADVVVIGGGLSGLTAAFQLRQKAGVSVVVLEKEEHAGGKTWRATLGPWTNPTGAVYTVAPYGKLIAFYKKLGLSPVKFQAPIHNFWQAGGPIREWISKEGLSKIWTDPADKPCLDRLMDKIVDIHAKDALTVPVADSDPALIARLDKVTFHDYLLKEFCPAAAQLGDYHARDVFGAGSGEFSAALGMSYLAAEEGPAFSWPGGLGEIASALTARLGPALRLGAFVEQVIPGEKDVTVIYRRGGKRYELKARAAVVAVPSMVGRRIIKGLSAEKEAAMAKVKYSSYATAAIHFKKAVYTDSFVLWTPGRAFHDLSFGGGERLEGYHPTLPGQVAVAYIPGGADGRKWMLAAPDAAIKAKVLKDLDVVLPGSAKQVIGFNLVRWGHAMPIMGPGYLTDVQPLLRKPQGRLFFAGVDLEVPAIEGAMFSGFQAADDVLAFLDKP